MPQEVCPRVHQVAGPELSHRADCQCYAVALGRGVLIDCGSGPGWPRIRDQLRAAGHDPERLETLVLTHAHLDHIGAAGQVKAASGCTICAHALDSAAIASGDPRRTAADWYGLALEPQPVDHQIEGHRASLDYPDGRLELLHTPGHTPGSMVAYLDTEAGRVLFGQDIHGPFHPAFGSDKAGWRRSMQAVLELEADILCEGHFGIFHGRNRVRDFIESHLARQR